MSTTLPSASTLTDEQLRMLAGEADGWKEIEPRRWSAYTDTYQTLCSPADDIAPGAPAKFYGYVPDYLHDANAALELLNRHGQWEVSRDDGLIAGIAVTIYKANKAVRCREPDFCRAAVLAFLRAEGKIL